MSVFFDTSVLVGGLIYFGPQSAPAQSLMHALSEDKLSDVSTAWHCCLEFYSVSTRLPQEYRLTPGDAVRLLQHEILARMTVHDLPMADREALLRACEQDGIAGGRIYDAHIADVARAAGATVVVTDNRRHFLTALRHGLRVETPGEFLTQLKTRKR